MAPTLGMILNFIYTQLFVTVPKPTTPFTDRVVIVTGGNVGLGLETARSIAALGAAKVIISSRSTAKGEAARQSILATCPNAAVEVWPLDLCSYDSVRAFAARATALPRLDALVCNAGVATGQFALAEGGHESTITTNVISTFLLSLLCLPALKETAVRTNTRAHLVVVSSEVHMFTGFAEARAPRLSPDASIFDALRDEAASDMLDRYNVSKLLEVFAVRAMAAAAGTDYPVVVTAPNPGFCASALRREFYEGSFAMRWGMWLMERLLERTSEEGARTFVACASPAAGAEYHGQYVSDAVPTQPGPLVRSDEGARLQRKVWAELSAILEGIEPGVTGNF